MPMPWKLSTFLVRHASGWRLAGVFAVTALCSGLIFPAVTRVIVDEGGIGPIDLLFFPGAQIMQEYLQSMGEAGRAYYCTVEMTVDIIYPLSYCLTLIWMISLGLRRAFGARHVLLRLNLVPVVTGIADFAENLGIVGQIMRWPARDSVIAMWTSVANGIKWLSIGASGLVALFTVAVVAWALLRSLFVAKTPGGSS